MGAGVGAGAAAVGAGALPSPPHDERAAVPNNRAASVEFLILQSVPYEIPGARLARPSACHKMESRPRDIQIGRKSASVQKIRALCRACGRRLSSVAGATLAFIACFVASDAAIPASLSFRACLAASSFSESGATKRTGRGRQGRTGKRDRGEQNLHGAVLSCVVDGTVSR